MDPLISSDRELSPEFNIHEEEKDESIRLLDL
jgi:hypothetical protein